IRVYVYVRSLLVVPYFYIYLFVRIRIRQSIHFLIITTFTINFFFSLGGVAGFKFDFTLSFMTNMIFVAHAGTMPEFSRRSQIKSSFIAAIRAFSRERQAFFAVKQKLVFGNIIILGAIYAGENFIQITIRDAFYFVWNRSA